MAKDGKIRVPVEINGNRVTMALDTTGSLPSIYSGATAALNLQPRQTIRRSVLRVGSTIVTNTVEISSLKMENLQWPRFHAVVYPWNKEFPALLSSDDVVGSLALSMFSDVDLDLDFGAKKLRVYSQKHCPGEVVYWAKEFDVLPLQKDRLGDTYILMMANGRPMAANIATMNDLSSIEEEAAKKVLGLDRSSAGVDAAGGSDGCTSCGSITLKAQGLEIHNAQVRIVRTISPGCHLLEPNFLGSAAKYDCGGAFPLHLGVNVLSRLHLYFANGERKLYFTDADARAVTRSTADASESAERK